MSQPDGARGLPGVRSLLRPRRAKCLFRLKMQASAISAASGNAQWLCEFCYTQKFGAVPKWPKGEVCKIPT